MTDGLGEANDDAVIERCKAGDAGAWQAFYERHFTFVVRTARRLGTPPEEAEDVMQEVFAVAFGKLGRFESGKATTWLYRICANVVSQQHRRRRVRQAFAHLFFAEPAEDRRTPEGQLAESQAQRQVGKILQRMKPKKREVFVLYELEGLSGDEIAERVGCPVQTVWTRLHHAREEFARLGSQEELLETARAAR
ncbi:MAG: RNA polymerase sigma factor [Myxococcales bacterium]